MRVSAFATAVALLVSLVPTVAAAAEDAPVRALFGTDGSGRTFVHEMDRGQTHHVADGNFVIEVSPDGRLLSSVGWYQGIRYLRPGGAATMLVGDDITSLQTSWASSSQEFAYTEGTGGATVDALYVADVIENRVLKLPVESAGGMDFAPHRRAVASVLANGSIVLHDLTSGETETIVPNDEMSMYASWPQWSPSGDVIAYRWGWNGHGEELRITAPDTGVTTVLKTVGDFDARIDTHLAWSPDGTRLAFVRSGWDDAAGDDVTEIIAIDRNGREQVLPTGDAGDVTDLVWTSTSTVAFSDGTSVRETSLAGQLSPVLFSATEISYTPDVELGWLPLVATARSTSDACPDGSVPPAGFNDVGPTNPHRPSIDCVVWWEVARGTGDGYAPGATVNRAQMATFVARAVTASGGTLPSSPPDAFGDDNGTPHEGAINQLAAAGIVSGTGPGTYGPGQPVSRAQMATFLSRTYQHRAGVELPAARGDYFVDDAGNPHEDRINRSAEAGLAGGTTKSTYDPSGLVRRDQMASFLARLLDLLVEDTSAAPPA